MDIGFVWEQAKQEVLERNYIPHIRPRGEEIAEKDKIPEFKSKY
jgi:hypothetical protein